MSPTLDCSRNGGDDDGDCSRDDDCCYCCCCCCCDYCYCDCCGLTSDATPYCLVSMMMKTKTKTFFRLAWPDLSLFVAF